MNKVINIDSGIELYKSFLQKGKNLNLSSGTTLNVTPKAAEEYNKLCKALESYGRSLLKENNLQYNRLTDANLQAFDIIKSAETESYRSLITGAIDNAKRNGKPFEFIYEGARYVAEVIDGEPRIRFLDDLVKESQAEIKRLGLMVDEEAQKISAQTIELANRLGSASNGVETSQINEEYGKLTEEIVKKGYDYLEGYTPIKLATQSNETLLNLINKYRPGSGINYVYEKALQILKERGVM